MRSRKGYVLALQWLLVVAIAAWGATTGVWRAAPSVFWTLVVLSAAGNAALMRMPVSYFHQPAHWMTLFIADTTFVGAAIYCVVGFDSEVYLPYFLIVLIAALTRSLARALEVGGDDPGTLNNLAWVELKRGNPEEALHLVERALGSDPSPRYPYLDTRARILKALGRYEEALVQAAAALKMTPEHDPGMRKGLEELIRELEKEAPGAGYY